MSTPLAFLNGQLIPQHQATLPFHDAGFIMGATVTDLCRTARHRLYRWDDHLARFVQSCRIARIPLAVPEIELTRIANELAAHNAGLLPVNGEVALVVFATPGPIGFYGGLEGGAGDGPPTLGMHTFPLPFARYLRLFREGAQLGVPSIRQVPAKSVDPSIKQRSRLHWWLADREVQAAYPGASAVLLDQEGHLTETAAANLLIVQGGTVLSPPRDAILNGISLLTVRELCRELGVGFAEKPLTVQDAETADEIMLTSTPYCLCAVSQFNGRGVPWPGKVFERLLAAWSQQIGLDIRRQIETVP